MGELSERPLAPIVRDEVWSTDMRRPAIIAKGIICCVAALIVHAARAGEVAGVTMPKLVSVAGMELRLNGMGLLKKAAFFKVYVVGLYLEKPTRDAQAAITTDEAKRIVISMLRNVSREMFVHAVETGIMRNSGREMPRLRARLDRLEQALPDLKKGEVLDMTYLPGVGTLVRGGDRTMTIPGKDFSDAFFSIWLGPKPISSALKRQLLGGWPGAIATIFLACLPKSWRLRMFVPFIRPCLKSAGRAKFGSDRMPVI